MMKILIPLVLALVGLGAGVGAGLMLRPPPAETAAVECDAADGEEAAAEVPCDELASDPFDPEHDGADQAEEEVLLTFVPFEKPFVVPVFEGERIAAMVVISLSVETGEEGVNRVSEMEPRLRDRFLKVFFLHSNSGGFNGSFTSGRKMTDLKTALLKAAREVVRDADISTVLITEIARQDI